MPAAGGQGSSPTSTADAGQPLTSRALLSWSAQGSSLFRTFDELIQVKGQSRETLDKCQLSS